VAEPGVATDITYIPMARAFLYLVVALDWFSRRVLSRRLSITIEAAFRVETLNDALAHYGKLDVSTPTMGRVRMRGLYGARSPAMASRSAWTAKAPGATISSSSGYGAPSNTRKYLHAYESVSEGNASISRYSSTTATGHTRALTAKRGKSVLRTETTSLQSAIPLELVASLFRPVCVRSASARQYPRNLRSSASFEIDRDQRVTVPIRILLLAWTLAWFGPSSAFAQATSYASVETSSGTPIRLSYHASAHKNCTPAPPPTIEVTERPKAGALMVRRGMLATDKLTNCGPIRLPVLVIFYNPKEGYVGPDHVIYEVTDSNGKVNTYDVTITVKAGPPGPAPKGQPGTTPSGKPGTKI
jgi:hypothetical protein